MSKLVLPEFIYRAVRTSTAKSVSLHKTQDYITGLSFTDYPPIGAYIRFTSAKLIENNYVVRPDGDQLIVNIWTGELYIEEPYFDGTARFDFGHVSVWYNNHDYWYLWHQTDLANSGTTMISRPLQVFFDLRDEL
jgi:hypothetical protein